MNGGVGNDRGPHRTSGTPRHHEQLKLRYHHLRNRFRHDVYRVQEKMAVYCDGGAWNHCHRLRAVCGHRPREGGNPPFLPAEPNPGVEKPEAYPKSGGYQVLQGLYAIGSGGLLGKGLGQSIQKLSFLPEPQNDMIFAVICEELGLFGAVAVIFMFLFMLYRFLVIAGNAPDLFGAMLVTGVLAHIAIQVVLNIAVVTNVIPNTGITLPFISYGGTSVLFLMIEMGMVLSVSNQIRLEQQ